MLSKCIPCTLPPPAAVDNFKRQFAHLEGGGKGPAAHLGQATSLPRERVREFQSEAAKYLAGRGGTQHMSGAPGWGGVGRALG
jgi:hypothetical protein